MHIMVLGGAGKMGCIAVQSLAKETRATKVTIADVNLENARLVADTLQSEKLEIKKVDINDHAAFVAALEGVDACVNATVYYTNLKVMEACLEAGVQRVPAASGGAASPSVAPSTCFRTTSMKVTPS